MYCQKAHRFQPSGSMIYVYLHRGREYIQPHVESVSITTISCEFQLRSWRGVLETRCD